MNSWHAKPLPAHKQALGAQKCNRTIQDITLTISVKEEEQTRAAFRSDGQLVPTGQHGLQSLASLK
eukprot:4270755-Amphidinium_carterae.2